MVKFIRIVSSELVRHLLYFVVKYECSVEFEFFPPFPYPITYSHLNAPPFQCMYTLYTQLSHICNTFIQKYDKIINKCEKTFDKGKSIL